MHKEKTILGIDPGFKGALAFITAQAKCVYDMPTEEFKVNGFKRKRLSKGEIAGLIRRHAPTHAFLEAVHARPRDGSVAAFSFGRGYGTLETILELTDIPCTEVSPQRWKHAMACTADKVGAVMRASHLMPELAAQFRGARGGILDGRAEAALIALYGWGLTP
jgi:crossover junction endodeoxyribonuclease RuvC